MSSQIGERRGRGRPRGFEDAEVLDRVTDLFWRRGYEATSLGDLSEATGAARASLYKLYGDKEALLIRALETYAARFVRRIDAALDEGQPQQARIRQVLSASADRLSDPEAPPGCLRCRTTLERRGQSPALDAAIDRANESFLEQMTRLTGGDRARAIVLTGAVNGMVLLAEAGAGRADLAHVIDAALRT